MKIVKLLEETHYSEKKWMKEKVSSTYTKNEMGRISWKDKEAEGRSNKEEYKKLSKEEIQERARNGVCFKCGEKWDRKHKYETGHAFIIEDTIIKEIGRAHV